MRWLFLILTVLAAGVAFSSDNPVLMGVSFLLMFVFAFIAVLAFAQARIEAGSQSQISVLGAHEVQELRRQAAHKRVAAQAATRAAASRPAGGAVAGEYMASSGGGRGDRNDHGDLADGAGDGGGGD
jgi:hypothetical protein